MTKGTGFGKALPKNFRKVKSGYDQAFTLPKGTSAAPIKQAQAQARASKSKIKLSKAEAFLGGAFLGSGATMEIVRGAKSKRPKGGWTPGA